MGKHLQRTIGSKIGNKREREKDGRNCNILRFAEPKSLSIEPLSQDCRCLSAGNIKSDQVQRRIERLLQAVLYNCSLFTSFPPISPRKEFAFFILEFCKKKKKKNSTPIKISFTSNAMSHQNQSKFMLHIQQEHTKS